MGKLGFELDILADYILNEIKKAERIFADETTLPTLAPGSGSAKTAWLWAYARDDRTFAGNSPPMVAYRFEDSRATDCVARHLSGYRGILQVDGYGAYSKLVRKDGGTTALLWLAAGPIAVASSMNCMSPRAPRLQLRQSSEWQRFGK